MNYLAHFYLAEPTEASVLGAILGDFVKGRLQRQFPPEILHGISLHRKVDAYSDLHPLHTSSRTLFSGSFRRYAGIIIDVSYDHFLARHWSEYSSMPLRDFSALVYRVLDKNLDLLPPGLQRMAPHMIAGDWLSGYGEQEGLAQTLAGLGRRIKRENPLGLAFAEVRKNYPLIDQHFQEFFPELISFASKHYQSETSDLQPWKHPLPAFPNV